MFRNILSVSLILIVAMSMFWGCGDPKQTEKELFEIAEKAQQANNPLEAIKAYRTLIENYPSSENCPKAQFMIGFVYAEQYHDTVKALEAFDKFAKDYPNNELAPSADFMAKSLRGEVQDPLTTDK